ncbi:MAG: TonB-dependent receptor domain-containing protein, partial [Bryobacteraceae bacterium]
GNIIPADRISPISKKIADLTPSPNIGAPGTLGANYFANGAFAFDRDTIDTKLSAQPTDSLNVSARISYLDWRFTNPPLFGELGGRGIENRGSYDGTGSGDTVSMTFSGIYTATPSFIIDGYFGHTLIENQVENIRLDENLGLDFLGIPGTNGPTREDGGWPGFVVAGFDAFGRAQNNSPWNLNLPQSQYVANASWVKGNHNIKFGWSGLKVAIESREPSGNPGFFNFNRGVTGRAAGPDAPASVTNDFNAYAAFMLGLPNSIEKRVRTETGTARNISNSFYFGDRWRPTSKLTVSLGLRWEYFGVPVRSGDRGLEIYNFETNQLTLCGVGSFPQNCGFNMSKKHFAPRIGIAYRVSDTLVIRTGYGITWDPVNIGRNPAQTYPIISTVNLPAANDYSFVNPLAEGIPPVPLPDLGDGVIDLPKSVSVELADPNFRRNYIQSWNFTLQKQFGSNWIGEAGYVGNRQVRMQNRWNTNYGFIGGGTASMVLNRRFGRTATTNFYSDAGGFRGYYDSLQASLNRRFSAGYMLKVGYTWSKALGPNGNANGVDGYANNTPDYWPLIAKVPTSFNRAHNLNVSFAAELPFGAGKQWATQGLGAAVLGGWQFNGLLTAYSGSPFTVSADGASLNAPGN